MSLRSNTACESEERVKERERDILVSLFLLQVESSGVQAGGSQIPTYEIITSCQPRVVYSNGYYITSFAPPAATAESTDPAPAACYTLAATAATPSTAGSTPPALLYSGQGAAAPGGTPCFSCSCSSSSSVAPAQWTITKSAIVSTSTTVGVDHSS
jgi:hypothetical protein